MIKVENGTEDSRFKGKYKITLIYFCWSLEDSTYLIGGTKETHLTSTDK